MYMGHDAWIKMNKWMSEWMNDKIQVDFRRRIHALKIVVIRKYFSWRLHFINRYTNANITLHSFVEVTLLCQIYQIRVLCITLYKNNTDFLKLHYSLH